MTRQRPSFSTLALLAGLGLLLAACSSPGTRVVLLPQDNGQPSAVEVHASGGEQVLSKPYQRAIALASATGAPRVDEVDPARVRAENQSLFDLRPPKPERYVVHFGVGGILVTPASQQVMDAALANALATSSTDHFNCSTN